MERKLKLHPLLGAAALSVMVFSLVGIAAVTGLLSRSAATRAETAADASIPTPATAELVQAAAMDPVKVPQAPKPAARKAAVHKAVPVKVATETTPAPVASASVPPPPPASLPPEAPAPLAATPRPVCADCGTVENFRQVTVKGDGSALGAVAGGAAGAVVGHQFGRGSGKDLLTIAGAIGGAFAGHEIEKNARKKTRYEISVRMEDGSLKTIAQDAAPAWHIGEHVRVINNQVVASS